MDHAGRWPADRDGQRDAGRAVHRHRRRQHDHLPAQRHVRRHCSHVRAPPPGLGELSSQLACVSMYGLAGHCTLIRMRSSAPQPLVHAAAPLHDRTRMQCELALWSTAAYLFCRRCAGKQRAMRAVTSFPYQVACQSPCHRRMNESWELHEQPLLPWQLKDVQGCKVTLLMASTDEVRASQVRLLQPRDVQCGHRHGPGAEHHILLHVRCALHAVIRMLLVYVKGL